MRKYNIANYVRYKKDVEAQLKKVRKPVDGDYTPLTNEEIQINFLPLVETLARKQSTSDQASGVLSINDLLQEGALGLCAAVSKLDRELLIKSDDQEKTLKSFLSKRIKGAIRRSVDINRGDIRIPEHKLNEIRRNPKDEKMVAMFFNSVFSSIDANPNDDENMAYQVIDKSEPYNIALLNTYLLSLMRTHLTPTQYDVLRLSYGLDCDKHSANEIASKIGVNVATAHVRISQIKRDAIQVLINNVDSSQVLDYL
jgi:RNA polymerase sigma factor (sigma-70 family)|tara:strand:+ start:3880 stop:4644 length:765 start_codon:yes stop_codon:yes gene_type:complete